MPGLVSVTGGASGFYKVSCCLSFTGTNSSRWEGGKVARSY